MVNYDYNWWAEWARKNGKQQVEEWLQTQFRYAAASKLPPLAYLAREYRSKDNGTAKFFAEVAVEIGLIDPDEIDDEEDTTLATTRTASGARRKLGKRVTLNADDYMGNVPVDYARVADAIDKTKALRDYLTDEGVIGEKVVEKTVTIEVPSAAPSKDLLTPDEVTLIGEVLKIHEHAIHDETKADFIATNGANWQTNHARAQVALELRAKLGLPPHVFAAECCVPVVEEADVASLAITAHGIDAGRAAESMKQLEGNE
jgi:hypothetical protein